MASIGGRKSAERRAGETAPGTSKKTQLGQGLPQKNAGPLTRQQRVGQPNGQGQGNLFRDLTSEAPRASSPIWRHTEDCVSRCNSIPKANSMPPRANHRSDLHRIHATPFKTGTYKFIRTASNGPGPSVRRPGHHVPRYSRKTHPCDPATMQVHRAGGPEASGRLPRRGRMCYDPIPNWNCTDVAYDPLFAA